MTVYTEYIPNTGSKEKEELLIEEIQTFLHGKASLDMEEIERTPTFIKIPTTLAQDEVGKYIEGLAKRGASTKFCDDNTVWLYIRRPRGVPLWLQGICYVVVGVATAMLWWYWKEQISFWYEAAKIIYTS